MFQLTWSNVKGAIVSAVITGVLAIVGYIIGVGDVFNIDFRALVNVGSLSALTAITSLIKSLLTTKSGDFVGAVAVK